MRIHFDWIVFLVRCLVFAHRLVHRYLFQIFHKDELFAFVILWVCFDKSVDDIFPFLGLRLMLAHYTHNLERKMLCFVLIFIDWLSLDSSPPTNHFVCIMLKILIFKIASETWTWKNRIKICQWLDKQMTKIVQCHVYNAYKFGFSLTKFFSHRIFFPTVLSNLRKIFRESIAKIMGNSARCSMIMTMWTHLWRIHTHTPTPRTHDQPKTMWNHSD